MSEADPVSVELEGAFDLAGFEIDQVERVIMVASGVHQDFLAAVDENDRAGHVAGEIDSLSYRGDAPAVEEGEGGFVRTPAWSRLAGGSQIALEGKHQRGDAEGGKGGKQEPGFHDFADRIAGIARTLLTKFWRCIFAGKTGAA